MVLGDRMRDKPSRKVEACRITTGPMRSDESFGNNGAFIFDRDGVALFAMVSNGELWKPIKNYENLYKISTHGRVFGEPKIVDLPNGGKRVHAFVELSQELMKKGYRRVTLCKNGNRKKILVHVLVASAFIENQKNYPQVNHIDGIKSNNHVQNLEWCSQEYNQHHAIENGLTPGFTIEEINIIAERVKNGESTSEIAETLNIKRKSINHALGERGRKLIQDENTKWNGPDFWDHVSVSLPDNSRCPTWDEMCFIKNLFFRDDETVVQFHPKKSEYINNHPYTLHLWRPHAYDYSLPMQLLV